MSILILLTILISEIKKRILIFLIILVFEVRFKRTQNSRLISNIIKIQKIITSVSRTKKLSYIRKVN